MKKKVARRRKTGFWAKLADLSTAASLVLVVALAAAYFGKLGESEYKGNFRVIDGDSLTLGAERFRLEGIDAPEYRQFCKKNGKSWPCGRESAAYLRKLVKTASVRCRGSGLDKYQRVLVRCETEGKDLNGEMVRNGWAVAYGSYHQLEGLAKRERLGVWAGQFERPRQWREIHSDVLDVGAEHDWMETLVSKIRLWWDQLF